MNLLGFLERSWNGWTRSTAGFRRSAVAIEPDQNKSRPPWERVAPAAPRRGLDRRGCAAVKGPRRRRHPDVSVQAQLGLRAPRGGKSLAPSEAVPVLRLFLPEFRAARIDEFGNKPGVVRTAHKVGVVHDRLLEGDRCFDSANDVLAEGTAHAGDGVLA